MYMYGTDVKRLRGKGFKNIINLHGLLEAASDLRILEDLCEGIGADEKMPDGQSLNNIEEWFTDYEAAADWINNYDGTGCAGGHSGIAALLVEWISVTENVDFDIDIYDDIIGIYQDFPWKFTQENDGSYRNRNLTPEKTEEILKTYISKLLKVSADDIVIDYFDDAD